MRGIAFHDDPLQRDLSHSLPALLGRGAGQDGREPHRHGGKELQQGLDDPVAAGEAVPVNLAVWRHPFFHDLQQIALHISAVDRQGLP